VIDRRTLSHDVVLIARATRSFKEEVIDGEFEKKFLAPVNKISKCKKG
jgi:hypothetical protein